MYHGREVFFANLKKHVVIAKKVFNFKNLLKLFSLISGCISFRFFEYVSPPRYMEYFFNFDLLFNSTRFATRGTYRTGGDKRKSYFDFQSQSAQFFFYY